MRASRSSFVSPTTVQYDCTSPRYFFSGLDDRFTFANQAFLDHYGYTRSEHASRLSAMSRAAATVVQAAVLSCASF